MVRILKEIGPLKKLSLILLLVVLLPALFYSGYELTSMSTTEELMATIYRQQLDAILFSINQYAWDAANNWASTISILLNEYQQTDAASRTSAFTRFLEKNSPIRMLVFTDTALTDIRAYSLRGAIPRPDTQETALLQSLSANKEKIGRLVRFQRADYRKLEPIQLTGGTTGQPLALVFITKNSEDHPGIAAVVLDEQAFVRDVLSSKLQEAAGGEFVLAVLRGDSERPLFTTSLLPASELKQKKELWLFPNYYLGIRSKGTTIEELVQSRYRRNLALIIILDIVLMIGAWLVYKNIKREMAFVRMKSDFVSNVSHELRTPLSLIRMFAETLSMGRITNEEKQREYYATIVQEAERLTRLVNNILNFSKMEAGKKQYQFQEVDLNALAGGILETYKFHLQSEGFSPVVELAPVIPAIYADKEALSEAVINILDNAMKYSGAEKYLRVRSGSEGERIFLDIEDHGIGIPPEDQEKIFETFYRVPAGLVHEVKGSGLGLALVKHIMDAHEGKVIVTSTPGRGSTFRLQFPQKRKS
jgi:two-component system phosphate regulon sensor histidine kinase PhoR